MFSGEEDRTWRDDMALEAVHDFVARTVGAAAREEIDRSHILICRDSETGVVSYSGPFPNGLAALVAAEREREVDDATNDGAPMIYSVAALLSVSSPGHRLA